MPDQSDRQLPKIFLRSESARRFSSTDNSPRVSFLEEKQKTEGDLSRTDIKLMPLITEDKKRPCSRAKFDENIYRMQSEHFVRHCDVPCPFPSSPIFPNPTLWTEFSLIRTVSNV